MTNGLSFDVEDWFHVENLREFCQRNKWDNFELRINQNTEKILELLDKFNIKATFFILGWVAERAHDLVKTIANEGHEIASHGYNHEIIYNLKPEQFEEDLLKSKNILENLSNQKVVGYRAPNFSITDKSLWAIDILVKNGFKYDSSIFPTSFHDRYGLKGSETYTYTYKNGLKEIPLTTIKMGKYNFPIAGGGYFRLFPYQLYKYLLKTVNKDGKYFVFYLHPWEIDAGQPRVDINFRYKFRHYVNLSKTYKKLTFLLQDFQFSTLNSLLINGNE